MGCIQNFLLENLKERGPLEGRRLYENVIEAYLKKFVISEHL